MVAIQQRAQGEDLLRLLAGFLPAQGRNGIDINLVDQLTLLENQLLALAIDPLDRLTDRRAAGGDRHCNGSGTKT